MKTRLLLFMVIIPFIKLNGQWTLQESHTHADITDVFFLDDQIGFAVGDSGLFLKTVNGGGIWIKSVIDPSSRFEAVTATDENTVFAGGKALYRSTDGGSSWALVSDAFQVLHRTIVNASVGYAKS